ncbi:MAG: GNAT family N-acetyltransferase [Chloroflexi bacterium]|nr:GNAT family N-acetyltransferase [Chloroflexota bacterium]
MANRQLPPNYTIRPPVIDDLQAVTDLISACDIAEYGQSDFTTEEMLTDWNKPDFDLATDAWVITTFDGQVAAYEEIWNRHDHVRLQADGYVHPDHRNLGIGTYLLRVMEARARQHIPVAPEGQQVVVTAGVSEADTTAHPLFQQEGYTVERHFWRMEIEFTDPPPTPQYPASIAFRTLQPGENPRQIFNSLEEAFRDHWGYTPWNYEWWTARNFNRENFDPTLWFLAIDGNEIAGACNCKYLGDIGWVDQLGIRRPWRQQGLGLALLSLAFGEFYRRGTHKVGLGVDAQNPTGATRLYRRAGMHVARQYTAYLKVLRSGSTG